MRQSEYNTRRPDADYGIHTAPAAVHRESAVSKLVSSLSFPDNYSLPSRAPLKTVFKYFVWLHKDEYSKKYIGTLISTYKHLAPLYEKPYWLIRPNHINSCMKGLTNNLKNGMIVLYHHLDNLAYEKDLISKRYSQSLKKIRIQETDRLNEFSQDEIDALIPHIGELEVDMTLVLLYTGLRTQEICELTFDEIDRDCIHIPNEWTRQFGRNIPIHPLIRQSLHRVLSFLQDRDAKNVTKDRRCRGVLQMVYKATEKYCEKRHSVMQCRSSFEIRVREAGASEGVIQYLLGVMAHSLRRYQQVYIHPSEEKVAQLVMKMK
ncbi:MAG: site-specific integrase [Lachnospiraceae bacterium]|nr:site-specific integrase [Lachnospiraceae bacterium]